MNKMKKYLGIFIAVLILLIACDRGNRINCPDFSKDRLSKIDTFFNDKIAKKELAGVVTLIAKNGKIQHFKSFGYIDIEKSIPMNNDVIIPIGSMTKVITSIAVMILYEEGKFLLNDPVEKYIPEFRDLEVLFKSDTLLIENLKSKPTIRDLMRHTSGMVYSGGNTVSDSLYREAGFRNWDKSLPEFIEKVSEIPLAFQPGEKYQYSYSYDVLGYFVEVLSGLPLDKFCKERIFSPLGLQNTGFFVPTEISGQLSNLYVYQDSILKVEDFRDSSIYNQLPKAISGGGGWWNSYGGVVTTVSDFYIISDMMLNFGEYNGQRILSRKSVELMISNQIGNLRGKGRGYGLGVGVITSIGDYGEIGSDNEIYWAGAPYSTFFWIDYRERLVGIIFPNTAPYGHLDMMNKFKVLTLQAINK
jgi:CubicO group peptidase (beta-lactamase class C family)